MRFKDFVNESITAQNISSLGSMGLLRKQFPGVKDNDIAASVLSLMANDPALRQYVARNADTFNLQILDGAIKSRLLADSSKLDRLKQFLPQGTTTAPDKMSAYDAFLKMRQGTGLNDNPIKPTFQKDEPIPPPISKQEYEKYKGVDNPPVEIRNKFYDNGFLWKEVGGYGLKRIFRWMPPMKFKFSD